MKNLLLIGGGGHCRSCIDVIELSQRYSIAGIVARESEPGSTVLSYPILGDDDDLPHLLKEYPAALITVGQIKSAESRIRLFERLKNLGAELPSVVSSHAHVSRHALLAEGTVVMHGAIINASACVGENCIINSQALIEHDSVVEAHCHISTGAKLNGNVYVERGCFIGSGSIVREGVRIGFRSLIPAGSVVLSDVEAGTIYRGRE
jgi:sugar O-acyltransferase (sialic acid O-acetyltransferase NeuD family)